MRNISIAVTIRGIYSTALTLLLGRAEFLIVNPSPAIAARLAIRRSFYPEQVDVVDREDGQGVVIEGEGRALAAVLRVLRGRLPYAVVRQHEDHVDVEFPRPSKRALDRIRAQQVPTLAGHHQLRLIDSARLDEAEKELAAHREEGGTIARELRQELVYAALTPGRELRIEHVKPDGRVLLLSEGEIIHFEEQNRSLVMKRSRFKGRSVYDGLQAPKEEGDYAMTEVSEGGWTLKHSYFSRDGVFKGDYLNINTPVELYPDRIRYIDLEVDMVRWPDGRTVVIDETSLQRAVNSGYVTRQLAAKALAVAKELA